MAEVNLTNFSRTDPPSRKTTAGKEGVYVMKRLMMWAGALLLGVLPVIALGQATWSAPENLWPDSLKSICQWDLLVAENGSIFAATVATQGIGEGPVYRSTDNGRTWENLFKKGSNGLTSTLGFGVFQNTKSKAILLGTLDGVFRSTDNGETWRQPAPPPPYGWQSSARRFATDGKGRIFAGASIGSKWGVGPILVSDDGGLSWRYVVIDSSHALGVMEMCVAPNGTIFAATTALSPVYYGIYRSTDNGETWRQANNGLSNLDMASVTCDETGAVYAGSMNGLFRSTDNGESWRKVGFEKNIVADILVVRPDLIFIANAPNGAPAGIFRYDGRSWSQIGPPPAGGDCLARSGSGILIGTFGGIYLASDVITRVEEPEPMGIPSSFALHQNYPNPFNPSTTIKFDLPHREYVNLTIYNMIGQRVETLVDGEKGAGIHRIVWNAGNLPSGVYLYRLQTGTFMQAKRMVLVK